MSTAEQMSNSSDEAKTRTQNQRHVEVHGGCVLKVGVMKLGAPLISFNFIFLFFFSLLCQGFCFEGAYAKLLGAILITLSHFWSRGSSALSISPYILYFVLINSWTPWGLVCTHACVETGLLT